MRYEENVLRTMAVFKIACPKASIRLAGGKKARLSTETIEKAFNINLSKRVKAIRVLLLELNRIASHLLWIGAFLMDLGAVSPFFYAFREREMILEYFGIMHICYIILLIIMINF